MALTRVKQGLIGKIPGPVWVGVGGSTLLGFFTANPELSVAAALLLLWFFLMLWRPGEPPILLLVVGFQWLQVTTKLIHANVRGIPIQSLSDYGGDVELAVWLSIAGLAVLVLGIRLALTGLPFIDPELARNLSRSLSVKRLWLIYVLSVPISLIIASFAWAIPGGTQIALALSSMRWVAFFVFAYVSLVKMQYIHLLLVAVGIELAMGIGGYFADFKTVFFVGILAYLAAGRKLTTTQITIVFCFMLMLLSLSLIWTVVKDEYRAYLNADSSAQIVTRGYFERTDKLIEMVSEVSGKDLTEAVGKLAERIAYVDFLAMTVSWVPRVVEHEYGRLWGAALSHVFMPRLFFPGKAVLPNDSENTSYYTGLYVSGEADGTSVSMGYVAEAYIDFGRYGMFVLIFLLGVLLGLIYRFFRTRRKIPIVFGYGFVVTALLEAYKFETTSVKIIGSVVTVFLVSYVVQRIFLRDLLRWLVIRRRPASGPSPPLMSTY